MEKDKYFKNERQKQNNEAMEPSKKRKLLLEKKRPARITAKLELQKKGTKQYKTMDSAKN